jgi:hypothetical protein
MYRNAIKQILLITNKTNRKKRKVENDEIKNSHLATIMSKVEFAGGSQKVLQ